MTRRLRHLVILLVVVSLSAVCSQGQELPDMKVTMMPAPAADAASERSVGVAATVAFTEGPTVDADGKRLLYRSAEQPDHETVDRRRTHDLPST